MKVKVVAPGVCSGEFEVTEASTVEQVLSRANVPTNTSKQLLLNQRNTDLNETTHDGDTIYLAPRVASNS